MIMSVYLHKYIVDILHCFGDLNTVVNRVLQDCAASELGLTDKPTCPDRAGSVRYDIDIVNDEYLTLCELYPATSPKVSLRRILYWFVDCELYTEFGWEVTHEYTNTVREKICKKIDRICADLNSLRKLLDDNERDTVNNVIEELQRLK